jgi:hypothetical protein
MIENYLNGKPWQRFMSYAPIQTGLARAGFQPYQLGVDPPATTPLALGRVSPDPVRTRSRVTFTLAQRSNVDLSMLDVQGRSVRRLASGFHDAGEHSLDVPRDGLSAGIYWLRLRSGGDVLYTRFAVLP